MLSVFDFQEQPVRIVDQAGALWFLVNDVCRILGLSNVTESTRTLDGDELNSVILKSGLQERKMVTVSESGLYALIFKSRKPQAKAFRKWVTSEVLPAIRQTGSFSAEPVKASLAAELPAKPLALPMPLETVRAFCKLSVHAWPTAALGEFARLVKRTAGAFGWMTKRDVDGWPVFPIDFLEQLWGEYESSEEHSPMLRMRLVLIAKASELPGDTVLTLKEVVAHDLSEADSRSLGIALKPWRGQVLFDRQGRKFRMSHHRTSAGARFQFSFLD